MIKPKPPVKSDSKQFEYAVTYHAIRCPRCGSKKCKCYHSAAPIRYHKCRACSMNFKSVEET
ncbi:MAG: hypothetical protein A3E74_06335 [Omnitrophica bacterium RIFCSPHIGHO2_12_FULL_44_12]|nr:MAG: hypothetical protein A3E74_06335 [Omnitrophica bacterium RIFCSPHIGHO2_12_FULL_44_12]OGX04970.1 MAG: hypothetical protein A3J12_02035 [Omnitrophica bacterium RIFCSPLOWO2_02_FULL_44_11]